MEGRRRQEPLRARRLWTVAPIRAGDYITKPFDLDEFIARVRIALRRNWVDLGQLVLGPVRVDFDSRSAVRGPRPLRLTEREFELLRYLASRPGEVVPRHELLRAIWAYARAPYTRSV